jgi:hypothetical protein
MQIHLKSWLYHQCLVYITSLHQLDLLPITYWHEYLDLVLINKYTYIDESALPKIAESGITRSETNENLIKPAAHESYLLSKKLLVPVSSADS